MIMANDPINAEARGCLRAFKRRLVTDYVGIDQIYKSITNGTICDFMLKKGAGRKRVFDRINGALLKHGARLERSRLSGKQPFAVWSILKPREAVNCCSKLQRDLQDCVCVNYFSIGWSPTVVGAMEGLWSIEITDHALGRFFQRNPFGDLRSAILATHRDVIRLAHDVLELKRFRLRAGDHVWECEVRAGEDISLQNELTVHLLIRTYLHFDQISPHQERAVIVAEGDDNYYLAPAPFRLMHHDGKNLNIAIPTGWLETSASIARSA
jgi:hypothetical protein